MRILSDFEGGAIEIVKARSPGAIELALRSDLRHPMRQWFAFRIADAHGKRTRIRIVNAGEATYADAFAGYRACASDDGETWFRLPTSFDGQVLELAVTPRGDVEIAYFATYPPARSLRLARRVARARHGRVETLGSTVNGRPIRLFVLGPERGGDELKIWIQGRQHPGETGAEWCLEGVVERLLGRPDALVKALFERATFYVVPNMNPDGSALGNHRSNAAGVDLNRAWLAPDPAAAPEVHFVRAKMEQVGVDAFFDVHADERNPYVFAAGCEGNPGYSERIDALEDLFMDALSDLDPAFQRTYGYERDAPGAGDLSCASNWVGERFDALSLTLELPFKELAGTNGPPDASPAFAKALGKNLLEAIYVSLDSLR